MSGQKEKFRQERESSEKQVWTLRVWDGDFGIPSIDPNNLFIYAYVKFMRPRTIVEYSTNPLIKLPKLCISTHQQNVCVSEEVYASTNDILKYLKLNKTPELDETLEDGEIYDCRLYRSIINKELLPGVLYTFWQDDQNYYDFTRKWYSNAVFFPLNIFYAVFRRKAITNYLQSSILKEQMDHYDTIIINQAKECISMLSNKLSDKTFFYYQFSSLDAMVYAYLAPLLSAPLCNKELQEYLKEHENLVQLILRVKKHVCPKLTDKFKYIKNPKEEQELGSSPGIVILSIFITASTVVLYGMLTGVLPHIKRLKFF